MTFKDILDNSLTNDEKRNLKEISKGRDWPFLRDTVEHHIMHWTYNLLTENDKEVGNEADQLKALRGFVNGWRVIKRLIENKDE